MPPEQSLRVAMVVFNAVGRGTYFRALGLARGLVARGHQVSLLAMARAPRWRPHRFMEDGVEVIAFPDWLPGSLRSGWDPVETVERIAWLARRPFDLVHAFEGRPTAILPALFAARRWRIPLVMDWCDWFGAGGSVEERPNPLVRALLRPVETWFEECFRSQARATTVINSVLRQKAISLGVAPETILLLPNGADCHRLRPIPREEARAVLGLDPHRPLIGYVGSAFPADLALMAAALERLRQLLSDAQLLRLGQHTYALSSHQAIAPAVIEPGQLSDADLNLYLAACDLFWLPLANTGANRGRWPAKLTDYLCVGRPIVATRVGDVQALFEAEPLGRLADPTPDDVARQTLALLDEAETLCDRYEIARQRLLQQRFCWDQLAAALEQHYFRWLA